MEDILHQELERIDEMPKLGLTLVEYSVYGLGINIAPRKRSSKPSRLLFLAALFVHVSIVYSLIRFIIYHSEESLDAYSEALTLTFQLSVGTVKVFYFYWVRDSCAFLFQATEAGEVLRDSGIFGLDLPGKLDLSKQVGAILSKNWLLINRQVVFFFMFISVPVAYYMVRPFLYYIYNCYIVQDECQMTFTYPARVPFIEVGNHEYPSFSFRFLLLQGGPVWSMLVIYGFNSMFVVLTKHDEGLLQVLRHLVAQSTSDAVPKHLRVQYLRCCIRLYARVSRHHAQIETLFKYIILVQVVVSCILLCMLLYTLSTDSSLDGISRIFSYLATIVLEFSLFNVNAQDVETQSELLYLDWYGCDWYNETRDFQFMIRMMLMFSRRTFALSVGGFTKMSHQLLVQVFRLSGNCYILLKNVNNK